MKTNLGYSETHLIDHILGRVYQAMEFDNDMQEYTDGGNFVLSLSKEEMELFVDIIIPIKS